MAVIERRLLIALACVILLAFLAPFVLAGGRAVPTSADPAPTGPLAIEPPPAIATAYSRRLFVQAAGDDALPADAPDLIGIVGRLGDGAVALVRLADGSSRTIRIGESVDGWRLDALAIDAASFTRGGRQIRVAIATDDVSEAEDPPQ